MKTKGTSAAMFLIGLSLIFGACSPQPWTGIATNSIVINAPPEKVFAYLHDPANDKEINPDTTDLKCEGNGLDRICTWKTKAFGQTYEGRTIWMEYVPNRKSEVAILVNNGDGAYTITSLFLPHPQGTKLVSIAQFSYIRLPSILSKLPHHAVQKKFEEMGEESQKRIKAGVEKK